MIHTSDNDVFIIVLSCLSSITCELILQNGARDRKRIINLQARREFLKGEIPETLDYSIDDICLLHLDFTR